MEQKKEVTKNESEQLENNSFINLAKRTYDIAMTGIRIIGQDELNQTNLKYPIGYLYQKKPLFKKKKSTEEQSYTNLDVLNNDVEQFIKSTFNDQEEVSFSTLWRYCQFLRWVEKTCFYHNDLTKSIVCDSPMYSNNGETDKRVLVIQTTDVIIRLEMEIAKSSSVSSILDLDSVDRIFNNILIIEVKRKYGKLMNNKFVVIDARTTIRDSSDEYLLRTVNKIVKDGLETQFRSILQFISTKEFLEDFKFKE